MKKKIIVVDPEKEISDAFVNKALEIAPILATMGSTIFVARKLNEMMQKIKMKKMYEEINIPMVDKEFKMTRRDFLKGTMASGIMIVGGLNYIAATLEELGISEEKGKFLESFLLSSLDYRNALIAKGILKLSNEFEKVSIIYGAAHFTGIKKFLKNQVLLERKIGIYEKTYGIVNDADVDIYDFSKNM